MDIPHEPPTLSKSMVSAPSITDSLAPSGIVEFANRIALLIDQLVVDYNKKLYRDLGLGLEYFLYHRIGDYTGYPKSTVTIDGVRLLISYAFY